MGNELQAGFDLFGKIFRTRFADLAVIFLLNILSVFAIILPIAGYIGIGLIGQSIESQSKSLMDSVQYGSMNYNSLFIGFFSMLLLVVLASLVIAAFIDALVYVVIKKTHESTNDGVGASLSQAVNVWLRMIGFSLLQVLFIISLAIVAVICLIMIGFAFTPGVSTFIGILLVLTALIFCFYHFGPLFIFAPLEVALTKKPVIQCFLDSLSKAAAFKVPIFWIMLVIGASQFVLGIILGLTKIPFLSNIVLIPLAILIPCLIYPYYLKYKAQFETPIQIQPIDVNIQENQDNKNDINTGL